MKLLHTAVKLDGKKSKLKEELSSIVGLLSKPALFVGESKIYEPHANADDRSQQMPPEFKKVQERALDVLKNVKKETSDLIDLVFTQDSGNTQAKADIVVDGVVIKQDVPVTTLMFLLKQMQELLNIVKHVPTPDPSIDWVYDENAGLLTSKTDQVTLRTQKVPEVLKKFEPVGQHPGQADIIHVDKPIGEYHKKLFSGALPASQKIQMIERINKLIEALKTARETANLLDIKEQKIADDLFNYVFNFQNT